MAKKIFLLSLMFLLASTAAWGGFINGGFEDGDFTGWTMSGGYFNGTYHYTGDPGKSAIVGVGNDPYSGRPMVYSGNYAARVNNYDNGYHFSTISQTVTNWSSSNLYFTWSAVLEDPGHDAAHQPNFSLQVKDNTTGLSLYNTVFNSTTMPASMRHHGLADWIYTDWMLVDINTSNLKGHDLTLTLLASDCGYGGHGGYAYLDTFSPTLPTANPGVNPATPINPGGANVPVPPSLLLLASGLVGMGGLRFYRKRS